ncbi:hypothetical protein ACWGH8_37235 [Nonomuraea muscovyensis]
MAPDGDRPGGGLDGGGAVAVAVARADHCLSSSAATARDAAREAAGENWHESGLVFTTASGRPVEQSNFRRSFAGACDKAGVSKVHVHATRKTCASLPVALDVHNILLAKNGRIFTGNGFHLREGRSASDRD